MKTHILGALCSVLLFTAAAAAVPLLTMTELSSTELTWEWSDGLGSGTLLTSIPDRWSRTIITGPTQDLFGDSRITYLAWWREPGSTSNQQLNRMQLSNLGNGIWELSVRSETQRGEGEVGFLRSDGVIIDVDVGVIQARFFDQRGAVPEAGSALFMLVLSLAGLAWFQRCISRPTAMPAESRP